MVIWANVGEGENALVEYMDNYINNEEKAWPELRSFCIGIEVLLSVCILFMKTVDFTNRR